MLADVLCLVDMELEHKNNGAQKDQRKQLASLVIECVKKDVLTADICKERLEASMLVLVGYAKSIDDFEKVTIQRKKTTLYFKQQKFNLLREESEGYSKLAVELGSASTDSAAILLSSNSKPKSPPITWAQMKKATAAINTPPHCGPLPGSEVAL